jgi:hypothetical protein
MREREREKKKSDPRALNGICPYYTMFPLDFPMRHLADVRQGAWVLDPFCGRGTTAFAARMLGLSSVGYDISPVAVAIARAKLVNVRPESIVRLARRLLSVGASTPPKGRFWQLAYHPRTLRDLVRLRLGLRGMHGSTAAALRVVVMGGLHGPQPKSKHSYFSNQMPRTFAPKPDYAVRFWEERGLVAPEVDVLTIIRERSKRFYDDPAPRISAEVYRRDARIMPRNKRRFAAIITSPPYFGMDTYTSDQWLRLWFLGGPAQPQYNRATQLSRGTADDFVRALGKAWRTVAYRAELNAKLVIRFGAINSRKSNPEDLIHRSLAASGVDWVVDSITDAGHATGGRRQSVQMGDIARAATALAEIDVVCHLLRPFKAKH